MSKKPAKSEREVEIPDWAEDVTPSDEVMKKFYAPTGSFKPGPIVVQPPAPAATPPVATSEEEDGAKGVTAQTGHSEIIDDSPEIAPAGSLTETNVRGKEGRSEERPSPPPPEIKNQPPTEGTVPAAVLEASEAPSEPIREAITEASTSPQLIIFEEFSRKWKRYLYPGQMAVMRTLFELTVAKGTTECFTRYSELAAATKMTRRNCINVMNSLVDRGFVTRLEVRNDATGKGIRLRIHTDPLF